MSAGVIIGGFVFYFLIYAIGFVLGSYGGMFSECSGVINIALEGSMVVGAFSGLIFLQMMAKFLPETIWLTSTVGGVTLLYFLAALVSIAFSIIFSFLLSFVSIKLKADQTIVGTALNTVAVAVCTIVNTFITGKENTEVDNVNLFKSINFNVNTGVEFIDSAFSGLNISILIGLIVIIVLWLVMNKMRFGLRLRACGENPGAADSVGINVSKMRYLGTMIGSAAAGLGGFIIFSNLPLGSWNISALGIGFLVLAIEIFGNWKATNILFGSLFFAFFFAFAPVFTSNVMSDPDINDAIKGTIFGTKAFYYMLPYLIAFLTLIVFSKKSRAPKAEGKPYDKSTR